MSENNNLIWHTETHKLSELRGYENNPRKLTEKNRAELEESLKKYSLVDIPAVNTDYTVISGNQRVKILFDLYGTAYELDVRVPNREITQEEIEDYNIYANTHMGEWDEDKLTIIPLHRLKKFGFDKNIRKIYQLAEYKDKEIKEVKYKEKNELIIYNLELNKLEELYNELIERGFKCKISTL